MTFVLDPFQREAIRYIEEEHSVFITAPTGAGKTLIAERAVEQAMSRREKVIYTAPIKALSNQKFRDFRARFGDDQVGILTGDVSINPEAPILIMTTEIYRNSLFDDSSRIQNVGWVIFDEIHYLDDPERGTVWEEAILFTPAEIRILALSATAPNVRQLAEWIRLIHERPIAVIEETKRPVPLEFLFQCQGRIMNDMKQLRREGYLSRDSWKITLRDRHRGIVLRAKPNRVDHLIEHLKAKDRLPAIYFVFGRRRAEYLAEEIMRFDFLKPEEYREITGKYQSLLERYDLKSERSAQDLTPFIERGIAYHHAGMLPSLKEVVEQLFTSRLIKVIFTTETFALGINMPARSVVLDELEKFYGSGFRFLTNRDFYQMAGRAGRRGMDERGFVYVRVLPHQIPYPEVERILYGKPESIQSQLNTAYATLLNLYRTLGPKLIEIYPRSFHHFQSYRKKREEGARLITNKLALLEEMNYLRGGADWGLLPKGEFGSTLFGYELLLAEMHQAGMLDGLDQVELTTLLSGLIYEPRKGDQTPRLSPGQEKLRKLSEHHVRQINRRELKYQIYPHTKKAHFNLARAVEAWTLGESFDKLGRLTPTDEGELVRHFRMIIQLLRELLSAPHTSEVLKIRAKEARDLINRDVVDAERQLRA